MINQDYFKGKNITVVGLGRSGFACAKLLYDIGARVSVSDKEESAQAMDYANQLPSAVSRELGRHSAQFIKGRDLVVASPGVESDSRPLLWAGEYGIPVISEIECAWRLCPGQVIAVTGTNGKTTTANLIGRALQADGRNAFILGNIGRPFSARVAEIQAADFVSLEVSSFQLETISKFKPKIALILNFSPDHLDRYADLSEYLSAKSRIFMNQDKGDYLVLNRDDALVRNLARQAKARVVYFDSQIDSNPNFAALKTVCSILGIGAGLCQDVLRKFSGLPHRLERLGEFKGREFINDSKATNPDSTLFALRSVNKPIILIAGGRDKGFDFSVAEDLITQKVRALIVLGQTKQKIRKIFQAKLPLSEAADLAEAVGLAFKQSQAGDCILLSPMCSSFDMFRDYEQRGQVFKQAVEELQKK